MYRNKFYITSYLFINSLGIRTDVSIKTNYEMNYIVILVHISSDKN